MLPFRRFAPKNANNKMRKMRMYINICVIRWQPHAICCAGNIQRQTMARKHSKSHLILLQERFTRITHMAIDLPEIYFIVLSLPIFASLRVAHRTSNSMCVSIAIFPLDTQKIGTKNNNKSTDDIAHSTWEMNVKYSPLFNMDWVQGASRTTLVSKHQRIACPERRRCFNLEK